MSISEKLNRVVARHDELRDLLSTQTDMDSQELQRISKEFAELIDVVRVVEEFRELENEVQGLVELIADPELAVVEAPRSGFVQVTLTDGQQVDLFVSHAPGTPENPLDTETVNAKARVLMTPILGEARTESLIEQINALEELTDVRELRQLLTL